MHPWIMCAEQNRDICANADLDALESIQYKKPQLFIEDVEVKRV